MIFSELAKTLPDYAKDQRLNVSSLLAETAAHRPAEVGHPRRRRPACAYKPVIDAIDGRSRADKLTPEAMNAAKAAACDHGDEQHLLSLHLPGLAPRLQDDAGQAAHECHRPPGIDKADFELYCLAVSAINGCGMCIDLHEKVVREHGITAEQVQAAVPARRWVTATRRTSRP